MKNWRSTLIITILMAIVALICFSFDRNKSTSTSKKKDTSIENVFKPKIRKIEGFKVDYVSKTLDPTIINVHVINGPLNIVIPTAKKRKLLSGMPVKIIKETSVSLNGVPMIDRYYIKAVCIKKISSFCNKVLQVNYTSLRTTRVVVKIDNIDQEITVPNDSHLMQGDMIDVIILTYEREPGDIFTEYVPLGPKRIHDPGKQTIKATWFIHVAFSFIKK